MMKHLIIPHPEIREDILHGGALGALGMLRWESHWISHLGSQRVWTSCVNGKGTARTKSGCWAASWVPCRARLAASTALCPPAANSALIMASDGLWDVFTNQQASPGLAG